MGMNRNNISEKNNPTFDITAMNHLVQKVINQRHSNGKKEYKVIWSGLTVEEATWEPEENLSCPDKINEFLKKYNQVVKKKKSLEQKKVNAQPISVQEIKKISLEKPQSGSQQKIVLNQSSNLNKQKLQASLFKNNITAPIKHQSSEHSKAAPLSINSQSQKLQKKIKNDEVSFISQPNKNLNQRIEKLEENEANEKDNTNEEKNKENNFKTVKNVEFIDQYEEETAQSEVLIQPSAQLNLIKMNERLDIQSIAGIFKSQVFNKDNKRNGMNFGFENIEVEKNQSPLFFIVKNRFHMEQKVVQRQRIISQQALKLIEFYEQLLMESQQEKN